jgi:hypothetical protein
MKFKKYINESDGTEVADLDEFNDIIHRKCKKYLNFIKSFRVPFKRGISSPHDMG